MICIWTGSWLVMGYLMFLFSKTSMACEDSWRLGKQKWKEAEMQCSEKWMYKKLAKCKWCLVKCSNVFHHLMPTNKNIAVGCNLACLSVFTILILQFIGYDTKILWQISIISLLFIAKHWTIIVSWSWHDHIWRSWLGPGAGSHQLGFQQIRSSIASELSIFR